MTENNGNAADILEDNKKLVSTFGAKPIQEIKDLPDFYTFKRGLIYSHRDFDKFYKALKKGEKCAIVSGFNASGTIHIGHKGVFDTNLYFQREFGVHVFIPISDDESYVAGKVKTQEEAMVNSIVLAKELLAYGFDPKKTYFIIDQVYTDIYNLAIRFSRRVTMSEIKAVYGYTNEDNPGLHFYPAVQASHVLLPQVKLGIKHVLVPIGPDEDSHLRIARDIARKEGLELPAVIHSAFMPGLDGQKMSKSRDNAIFLMDDAKTITKKVNRAFSGGQDTVEAQRRLGGNPDIDMSILYLEKFFLSDSEGAKVRDDYKKGKLLSGEVKKMLADKVIEYTQGIQKKVAAIKQSDVEKVMLHNGQI